MTREVVFAAGDVVLAKLSGYPWWPGMIIREDQVNEELLKIKPSTCKVWPVVFFPHVEYTWAKKSSLKHLSKEEIENFLQKAKSKRSDLIKAYSKAQTPPSLEDIKVPEAKPKTEKKRKLEPISRDRKKQESEFSTTQKSTLDKQKKWEKRKDSLMYLRHRLQRTLLQEGKEPIDKEIKDVDNWMSMLENYADIDVVLLRLTKIAKVMKRIIQLPNLLIADEIRLKERAKILLVNWEKTLGGSYTSQEVVQEI